MIVNNATDIIKTLVTKTSEGNWKVGNRYMKELEIDKGELYLFDSSWLESVYWNRDTRVAIVYFQQFATNGKEPVVLFKVDGRIIRRFREALSPGRFYLKQFSIRGYGEHITMSLKVFESAINELRGYLPEVFELFLKNSKVISTVFKNPGLAAARYVGNIVKNTFRVLGFPVIQSSANLVNVGRDIQALYGSVSGAGLLNKDFLRQGIIASQNVYLGDDLLKAINKFNSTKFLLDKKTALQGYNALLGTVNSRLFIANFLKGFSKLLLPISILSFVVGLPLSISNEVKKNLEIIGVAEARQKVINTKNISFLRRTTELKTKLLIGSSFSNPARKLQSIAIKPLQRYKTKLPKLSTPNPLITKLNETKKQIYKENKTLVRIKSVNESKQRNTKRVTKLKSYKSY